MTKRVHLLTTLLFLACLSVQAQGGRQQPRFISDIEFTFPGEASKTAGPNTPVNTADPKSSPVATAIESASNLQFKYAILLDIDVEMATNLTLFRFIDQWYGTPYRLGGTSKKGIDCSAFVQIMYNNVFDVSIPRTCRQQFGEVKRIALDDIKEGDLVFFNTTGGVSHVGMYLQNNKFVHAASSQGVSISDLSDPYWSRRIIGAGRLNPELAAK